MKNYLNELFAELTEQLDLTDTQEATITKAYNSVADWLNRNNSTLEKYDISIYPQGSMKLGTVVKPIARDDYDIDMVCILEKNSLGLSAKQVKELVGNRLKENAIYKQMLDDEGKRCWTLNYADSLNFHMDILPAIPHIGQSILATHKNSDGTYKFFLTNPHEYAEWFKNRAQKPVQNYHRDSIEKVPEYPRKTILQKVVQLLKRHRDVMFQKNQDVSPASIIITTLVGKIYNYETNLVEAFERIIKNLTSQIENKGGKLWVENPVCPEENFAEKWNDDHNKASAFSLWVKKINADYIKLIQSQTRNELLYNLYVMFGQNAIDLANNELGGFDAVVPQALQENKEIVPLDIQQALNVSHRQKAPWKLPSWNTATITTTARYNGQEFTLKSGTPINKKAQLIFKAVHNVKPPFRVKWQVTNTGKEALLKGCLRGDFYDSDLDFKNVRTETTSYTGIHFVQCFIIKKGQCVAKSKEFIVNIL